MIIISRVGGKMKLLSTCLMNHHESGVEFWAYNKIEGLIAHEYVL